MRFAAIIWAGPRNLKFDGSGPEVKFWKCDGLGRAAAHPFKI